MPIGLEEKEKLFLFQIVPSPNGTPSPPTIARPHHRNKFGIHRLKSNIVEPCLGRIDRHPIARPRAALGFLHARVKRRHRAKT